jgi:primosomal protein N' (replication factor Y)
MPETLINIAIPGTPGRPFTYSCPANNAASLEPGQRIVVPFGRRKSLGFFIEKTRQKPDAAIKSILSVIDYRSPFSHNMFTFLQWVGSYYYANIADVLAAALPPELRKIKKPGLIVNKSLLHDTIHPDIETDLLKKLENIDTVDGRLLSGLKNKYGRTIDRLIESGILIESWAKSRDDDNGILLGFTIHADKLDNANIGDTLLPLAESDRHYSKKEIMACGLSEYTFKKLKDKNIILPVYGLPDILPYIKPRPGIEQLVPTDEQASAIKILLDHSRGFHPALLYGITGSGKTLVYCHVAREIIARGQSVLFLVPEIALAGTVLASLRAYFPDRVAIMHSAVNPGERLGIWQKVREGHFDIVVGARSAIFAPLEKLGLIIVDEEHDESYKQDDPAPRFHARDAAVMRAKLLDIPVILGSATPSFESFNNAQKGRYNLIRLTRRPEKTSTPMVRLVDLKNEPFNIDQPYFSPILKSRVKEALSNKQQVILYLNRRGFSPRIKCTSCGQTPECPHCLVPLAYHKQGQKLVCHLCDYSLAHYDVCQNCGGTDFLYLGSGTQKIEDALAAVFDSPRAVRLDSDNARKREQAHIALNDFAQKKYDILLGTQMVTKGIDFPDVTIVGVLMADLGMDMPDFRAPEKLFAKLIQVSGRSGRGTIPGEVIIQTFQPELDLIDDAARQDYDSFYEREIITRRSLHYPPFSHLVNVRFSGKTEATVKIQSLQFKSELEKRLNNSNHKAIVLGPAMCHFYRLRGLYRRHIILKTGQINSFIRILSEWENTVRNFGLPSTVRVTIDIDPCDMM